MLQIDEIALSEATVWRIVEEALNAQMLTAPHRVTGMDYDRAGETVRFDLELMRNATGEMGHLVETGPVGVVEPTRANGPGAALPRRLVVAQHAEAGAATRKVTDEDKRAIRDMVVADRARTAASIAEELGLPVKQVAYFVTVYRKELAQAHGAARDGEGNNRLAAEAGHSAEPVQAQFRSDTEDRSAVRVVRADA